MDDKRTNGTGEPVKAKKRAPRKKAAGKRSGKKVSKKTSSSSPAVTVPKTTSATAPEKDSKGIYTLKPPPSE